MPRSKPAGGGPRYWTHDLKPSRHDLPLARGANGFRGSFALLRTAIEDFIAPNGGMSPPRG